MPEIDEYEHEILEAYEKGSLKSIATKSEIARFRAAARATAIKDRRVNIRLSAGDLQDIQAKALEQGMPYQTLIASMRRGVTPAPRPLSFCAELYLKNPLTSMIRST